MRRLVLDFRDISVRITKNKRIFEIPLEENIKHSGWKVRVNNKQQILTLTCSLQGKKDSCRDALEQTSDGEPEEPSQRERGRCLPELK
jgi:hypothetical protein